MGKMRLFAVILSGVDHERLGKIIETVTITDLWGQVRSMVSLSRSSCHSH